MSVEECLVCEAIGILPELHEKSKHWNRFE